MNVLKRIFGKSEASSEMLCPHCERAMGPKHDVDACARKRMSRRFFFQVVGGAAAAVAIAKVLPPAEPRDGIHFEWDSIERESANGLSIRVIREFDPRNGLAATRLDALYGFGTIYPEFSCFIDINSGDDAYDDDPDECLELPGPGFLQRPDRSLYPPTHCQVTL